MTLEERQSGPDQPQGVERIFDFRNPILAFKEGDIVHGMQKWEDVQLVLDRLTQTIIRTNLQDESAAAVIVNKLDLQSRVETIDHRIGCFARHTDFEIEVL